MCKTILALTALVMASAASAAAQYIPSRPIYFGAPRPVIVQQNVPSTAADLPRMRFGATGGLGLGGAPGTFYFEGSVQIGLQANDLFAVYYRPRGQAGLVWDSADTRAYAALFNPILVDFTIADIWQIGAGPSFDYMIYGQCNSTFCTDAGTIGVGADARIALSFPAFGDRRDLFAGYSRQGFTLELNLHLSAFGLDHTTFGYGQISVAAGWVMY